MATTGPKTFHFYRSHRFRLLLRLFGAIVVLGLLIGGTVFAVKMQKKVKRLFHDIEGLQLSQARSTISHNNEIISLQSEIRVSQTRQSQSISGQDRLINSLLKEIEGLKSTVKARSQNEETVLVQLAELKAAQAGSRRDIERLTLATKGNEVSYQELLDSFLRIRERNEELTHIIKVMEQMGSQAVQEIKTELISMKEKNEELTRNVRAMEEMGSQAIHEIKAELIRKVDSANFREEVVKAVEEVLQEKLQQEFNRMFQERKEVSQRKEELEGKVGFVHALDAQSALTHPYPEVEKISNEKQNTNDDKSQDPFYVSDASDGDASTSSEEETMKKRQEAIDKRVEELVKLFNRKDGENGKVLDADAKLKDPFYIEDVPVKPKVEAKKEEAPKAPEKPNPNDPFYIEDLDDIFATESESGSNWRQEYMGKAKDLLEKTKDGFKTAEQYVKDQIPIASKKLQEIGKEIEEQARKLNKEAKHQAEELAEKAKKVSKTILSLFNR